MVEELARKRTRRWLLAAAKLAVVVLVLWFIRSTVVDAWEQLGQRDWSVNIAWLILSGGFYLLGTLFCGIFWHRSLLALGQNVGLAQALRAYYIGHLGKYVPGKAMVVVLRTGLICGWGGDASLVAASVFFETLTMMSVGSLMAAAIVAVWFRQHPLLLWAALAVLLVAGLPTLPPLFRRIVRLLGVGKRDPRIAEKLASLDYGTMFLGWLFTAFGWIALGLSFWALLYSLGAASANPLESLHLYTAAVTLATVAGFISFVPGGAIIREAVLVELMVPYLGDAVALVSAILLRLVWLVAELIISGILYTGIGGKKTG